MNNEQNLNYPVKYAILSVKTAFSSDHGFCESEQDSDTITNIVLKCYVVGERKEYLSDGGFKKKYEVVFPYTRKNSPYLEFEKTVPEYNFYSQCVNSTFTDKLFNTFDDAQLVAEQANKDLLSYKIGALSLDKNFPEKLNAIKQKYQELSSRYKDFEKKFEQETCNMEITPSYNVSVASLIERVVESPSKFYTELANSLSVEEKEHLKQLIENKSCYNCTNGSCTIEQHEKVGLDELGKSQGSDCLGWNNKELIGKQLILTKNN